MQLPIRGLAEVMGMMLCTVFRNMVIDSSMVTPEKLKVHYYAMSDFQNVFYAHLMKVFLPNLVEE